MSNRLFRFFFKQTQPQCTRIIVYGFIFSFLISSTWAQEIAILQNCEPIAVAFNEPDSPPLVAFNDPEPPIDDPDRAPSQRRRRPLLRRAQRQFTPQKIPPKYQRFGCRREFSYRGQKRMVDSFHVTDGERLRPIIRNVPEAIAELDAYQSNRKKVRAAAYVSTAGLIITAAGFIVGSQARQSNTTAQNLRKIGVIGGLSLTLASTIYSLTLISSNERRLEAAVRLYNESRTSQAIELQFTTGGLF